MDPTALKRKLIAVLCQIQAESGLECPPLTGATIPVESLPKFDSMVWPVATTIFAIEIGTTIPDDVNIFVDEKTKLPRSIDVTAIFVCGLLKKQGEQETAAV